MCLVEVHPRTLCASYDDEPCLFTAVSLRLVDPLQRNKSNLLVLPSIYRGAVDLVEGLVDLMVLNFLRSAAIHLSASSLAIASRCVFGSRCGGSPSGFWPIAGEDNDGVRGGIAQTRRYKCRAN